MILPIVTSPAFPLTGSIITTHGLPTQTSESINERAHLALTITIRSTRLNATASAAAVVMNKKSISDKPSATDNEDTGKKDASNSKLGDNDDDNDNDRYLLDLLEKSLGDDMDLDAFI
eukprot:CAMPEP_0201635380 /NCGR_PEP_ID=MMETSP0493-20130528/7942_1 /ASSEMBLY_ACC=CAM_ASM_000838 /TAXON_ID=420259 /ORGANISM="Thalassiosira gravida, Strain GMp14c1" /LENGTH=117 /DNA_ID=CAMNT_0048107341 /DNA_START=6 /DNA_END=359 /DNA_ORIENTATION=+